MAPTNDAALIEAGVQDVLSEGQSAAVSGSQSGLTSGWILEISGDQGVALTVDEVREILDAAWRSSSSEPAFLRVLQWKTGDGEPEAVDFSDAADALGVRWSAYRGGITILSGALTQALGEWGGGE